MTHRQREQPGNRIRVRPEHSFRAAFTRRGNEEVYTLAGEPALLSGQPAAGTDVLNLSSKGLGIIDRIKQAGARQ